MQADGLLDVPGTTAIPTETSVLGQRQTRRAYVVLEHASPQVAGRPRLQEGKVAHKDVLPVAFTGAKGDAGRIEQAVIGGE
jgi:hypothetical protein